MKAVVWSKDNCGFCEQAKNLLKIKNIDYEERKIGYGYTREQLLEIAPNARAVPQIFINDQLVGSYQDLVKYLKEQNAS
jgi:glutaredoxin 3